MTPFSYFFLPFSYSLVPGDLVVLDNLSSHKSSAAIAAVEAKEKRGHRRKGVRTIFKIVLTPFSY
jgi:hypothetical protein